MEQDPQEALDRESLMAAIAAIGRRDFATARSLLQPIVANCPETYVYRFVENDKEYIRFWDNADFFAYLVDQKERAAGDGVPRQVVWIASVYPRAYFYLAFVALEEGCYGEARAYLEQALRLEPDQPQLLCELAAVEAQEGHREHAIELYRQALGARRASPAEVDALALRGLGVQLIDDGRLDEAEAHLRLAMLLDPRNPRASEELQYIDQLRAGKLPAREHLIAHQAAGPLRCEVCGQEPKAGGKSKVVKWNGRVVMVCGDCLKRGSRRWWEFWKR